MPKVSINFNENFHWPTTNPAAIEPNKLLNIQKDKTSNSKEHESVSPDPISGLKMVSARREKLEGGNGNSFVHFTLCHLSVC